jgi:hypothetical protein
MESGHGEKLSRKQELAIAALLTEPTISGAAASVQVSESRLRTWLKLPGFRDAYRAARMEVLASAITKLQRLCTKAVRTLERNLSNKDAAVANRAAFITLAFSMKGAHLVDLEERLEDLEARRVASGDDHEPLKIGTVQ